ncbi:uncharacterized protein LOC111353951 [Spodoptera litura]|uniref:Uncharacterized protein LOC111353951 n=1 Tax=Spodoptera litura TaxID=69820 RepID=A0A9J7E7I8_SPOLT|nr:uncharacterized protein LOC111353951 [Spodoptera litura]XP_022822948.1 uncharacterized protein LOC111353951 [Spodoptera litura]
MEQSEEPTIIIYNEDAKTSHTVKPNFIPNKTLNFDVPSMEDKETTEDTMSKEEIAKEILKEEIWKVFKEEESAIKNEVIKDEENTDDTDDEDDDDVIEIKRPHIVIEVSSDESDSNADFISLTPYKDAQPLKRCRTGISQSLQPRPKYARKEAIKTKIKKVMKKSYLENPFIRDLRKYFYIIDIPVREQIKVWLYTIQTRPEYSLKVLVCRVCNLDFAAGNLLRKHFAKHVVTSGKHQCNVCLLRFQTVNELKAHSMRLHVWFYRCRGCRKEFNNRDVAKFHQIIGCDIANTNPPNDLPILSISLQGEDKPWAATCDKID